MKKILFGDLISPKNRKIYEEVDKEIKKRWGHYLSCEEQKNLSKEEFAEYVDLMTRVEEGAYYGEDE